MDFVYILNQIDDVMYFPVLITVLTLAGLYFTVRTRGVQIRLLPESIKLLFERSESDSDSISSSQAMLVSLASIVGMGNIIGVSTAICLGGPGACFWMWVMCILAAAIAFIENTLAQIYKKIDENGQFYGGPSYYIEQGLNNHKLAIIFTIFLIATYAVGFVILGSYNIQAVFVDFSFYNPSVTPVIIGAILAILVGYCIFGGNKRIVKVTTTLVPSMGVLYVVIALIVILCNFSNIPSMFLLILQDAFNIKSIMGGVVGSCLVYGIKRGLLSNEAGVGSSPNASAAADVSHPVKQGLIQIITVFIDTMVICTATALMCLSTGVARNATVAGASYVFNASSTIFGSLGTIVIMVPLLLFGFTSILGNLYYADSALTFINREKRPSQHFMKVFYICATVIVFIGAIIPMDIAWAMADITMAAMALINIPVCIKLSKVAFSCLKDYESQRKEGKDPTFRASSIGLDEDKLDFWK